MTSYSILRSLVAVVLVGTCAVPAHADFELRDAAGRRILLRDDGTWLYVDDKPAVVAETPAASAAAAAETVAVQTAELELVGRSDTPAGCQFELQINNTLPYEIRNLVPDFRAFRNGGAPYATQTAAFIGIRPGDELVRRVRFPGIRCADIEKVQVLGGDRCEMGDLERFADVRGACLARVKLRPTTMVRFEK